MRNLANGITIFRLLLTIPIGYLLFQQRPVAATGLFAVFLLLDGIDGWVARKMKSESALGRNLDFIADGVGGIGLLICMTYLGTVPLWYLLALMPALAWQVYSVRLSSQLAKGTFVQWKYKHIAGTAYFGIIVLFMLELSYALVAAIVLLVVLYVYRLAYHAYIVYLLKNNFKQD